MDKALFAKFKATPFYSLNLERNKKLEQFKELIQLEYDWRAEVVKEIPAMLPQDEFMVLPTPAKRKLGPKPVEAPRFDLVAEEEETPPTPPSRPLRPPPTTRQLRSTARAGDESDAPTDDPLTLSQLESKPAAAGGRSLRSRVVKNAATDLSTASTGGGRKRAAAAKKLSSHSRTCAYSPRHVKHASPSAASTPEPFEAGKRKQRTLKLKRTATANVKRLFVTPEKRRQLEETKPTAMENEQEEKEKEKEERFVTALEASPVLPPEHSTPEPPTMRECRVLLSPIAHEVMERLLAPHADPEEEETEEEEEEESPAAKDCTVVLVSTPKTADKTVSLEVAKVESEPRKSSAVLVIDSGAEADLEDMVSTTPQPRPKRSSVAAAAAEEKQARASRASRKRSSRTANLSELSACSRKVLVGDQEESEAGASAATDDEEEEETVDEVAPLGPSVAVLQQYSKEQEQDSLITDDDWSTMDETGNLSTISQDGSNVSSLSTPLQHKFGGPNRARLAHSADGGRRFGKFSKWTARHRTSSQNTSAEQKNVSRCSNTSTPGRLQKRPSGVKNDVQEAEKRREFNERMRKEAQRLKEREERLLREREARKRANEERRQLVLSKGKASCTEKLNALRLQWEEKERHKQEMVRERKEEDQRRRMALASLRRQQEEREREERERRAREEAERKAQRQREEAERRAREEAERRARQEAERRARIEAERRAREEAYKKQREEERRLAKLEEERKRQEAREAARLAQKQQEQEALSILKTSNRMNLPFATPANLPTTKKRSSNEHYDISDLQSDQETDDDEHPRKKVPLWANRGAMVKLCRRFWQQETKWWKVFRPADTIVVDLNQIFTGSTRGFRNRTSSAVWDIPPALKSNRPYL